MPGLACTAPKIGGLRVMSRQRRIWLERQAVCSEPPSGPITGLSAHMLAGFALAVGGTIFSGAISIETAAKRWRVMHITFARLNGAEAQSVLPNVSHMACAA